jgi:hypothetical protein
MELMFGTNVREYGQLIGRLAGFEVDPATHRVLSVFISSDAELGNHVLMRPFASVLPEAGEIDIRPYTPTEDRAPREGVVLGRAARIVRSGREAGRLTGVDVGVGTGDLEGVIGRRSWWTRRFTLPAKAIDLSVPGEVRTPGSGSRAA